jgi:predicted small metal-binding protein
MTPHDNHVLNPTNNSFTHEEEYLGADIYKEDNTGFYFCAIYSYSRGRTMELYDKYIDNIYQTLNEVLAENYWEVLKKIKDHFQYVTDYTEPNQNLENLRESIIEKIKEQI